MNGGNRSRDLDGTFFNPSAGEVRSAKEEGGGEEEAYCFSDEMKMLELDDKFLLGTLNKKIIIDIISL